VSWFLFLDDWHSDWGEVESQSRFDFISLKAEDVEHFSCMYWPFAFLLRSIFSVCPFTDWVIGSLVFNFFELYIFNINSLSDE
jgi:hypothetical protein